MGELRRFRRLDPSRRRVVLYAEDESAWPHLRGLVTALVSRGCPVVYWTSSSADPILANPPPGVDAYFVGDGWVRTLLFMTVRADVLITSTPDLGAFQLKRSRVHAAHYVYVFHSMVSSHMIYRAAAFDHFDTVLCVGPHHVREIRAREARVGLSPKRLVPHGYLRYEALRAEAVAASRPREVQRSVLVAPSWGTNGLLETRGLELVGQLLEHDWRVTVRPHPMTWRRRSDVIRQIEQRFRGHPRLTTERGVTGSGSLLEASVLVSDWSGAALEYAFATERPVLFIDVPRKINNPDYEELECEPVEVALRQRIGEVLEPDRLPQVSDRLTHLLADRDRYGPQIRAAREEVLFREQGSAEVAADQVLGILEGLAPTARALPRKEGAPWVAASR